MKTNSQVLLSPRLYHGDVDGDGIDELIEIDGRHLYVFKAATDHPPVVDRACPSPITRLIVGDFVTRGREHGRDQVLAILENGELRGYAISDQRDELWWWFTQESFIRPTDQYLVGDFDGDGADEILVYTPSSGEIAFWRKGAAVFHRVTDWTLGNLANHDRVGKLLVAGNFGGTHDGTDLLLIDRARGQVKRFTAAKAPDGKRTFWWAFTTSDGQVGVDDDLCVANLEGGDTDGLLVRSGRDGSWRALRVEYLDGALPPANVDIGQLPVRRSAAGIVSAKVRDLAFRDEPGASRDDVLLMDESSGDLVRTDARWDKKRERYTWWWSYHSNLVLEPAPVRVRQAFQVILCRFKDTEAEETVETFFRRLFEPGSGGLVEYWHDVSLGALDVSGSRVDGWVTLDINRREASRYSRAGLVGLAMNAASKAGYPSMTTFQGRIGVFTHDYAKDDAPGAADDGSGSDDPDWIDGSTKGKLISAPPHGHSGTFIAHEMGHVIGFEHDLAADGVSSYGDKYCIMSAMSVRSFLAPTWGEPFGTFGPAMSFPQLQVKGWMPARRTLSVDREWLLDLYRRATEAQVGR